MNKIFIVIAIFLTIPVLVKAKCICGPESRDWKEVARKSKFVFLAEVISVSEDAANIKLLKSFKGDVNEKLFITYPEGGECNVNPKDFELGKRYLFTADAFANSEKTEIQPGVCGPPQEVEKNKKLLKWVKSQEFKKSQK